MPLFQTIMTILIILGKGLLWLFLGLLIILAIGILLVLLLCPVRLRTLLIYDENKLTCDLNIGFLHIRLFPRKPPRFKVRKFRSNSKAETSKEQSKKFLKNKKAKIKSQDKSEKPKEQNKKFDLHRLKEEIPNATQVLFPALKKTFLYLGRGLRMDPFNISLILAGQPDPASSAKSYGFLQATVWTGMPILERIICFPDPQIHVGTNFEGKQTQLKCQVGISLRIGTALKIGLSLLIPVIRWYFDLKKRQKYQEKLKTTY